MIAGHDRAEVTVLLLPDAEACRRHGAGGSDEALRRLLQQRLDRLAAEATGSSNRVVRALVLEEALSIDANELTDKGSINQRAVLAQRAHVVDELYTMPYSPRLLIAAHNRRRRPGWRARRRNGPGRAACIRGAAHWGWIGSTLLGRPVAPPGSHTGRGPMSSPGSPRVV